MKQIENFKYLPYKINKLLIYSSMFLTYSLILEESKYSKHFKDFKYFLTKNNHLIVHNDYFNEDIIKYACKFKLRELNKFDISGDILKQVNKHTIFIVFNTNIKDINIINEMTYLKNKYKNVYFVYLLKPYILRKLENSNIENYERI